MMLKYTWFNDFTWINVTMLIVTSSNWFDISWIIWSWCWDCWLLNWFWNWFCWKIVQFIVQVDCEIIEVQVLIEILETRFNHFANDYVCQWLNHSIRNCIRIVYKKCYLPWILQSQAYGEDSIVVEPWMPMVLAVERMNPSGGFLSPDLHQLNHMLVSKYIGWVE